MDRASLKQRLLNHLPTIAPSMLKCDYGNLEQEITQLAAAGADVLHWDVMDGHFGPNLSYGAPILKCVRKCTDLFFDVHLMISDPDRYLDDYIEAGSDAITFHLEAVSQPVDLLKRIQAAGVLSGLAFNPKTPVEEILPFAEHCDMILLMSVEPGFGGQSFIEASLP